MSSNDDIWFEPKMIGYGAGLPVAWQGWALLGGFIAATTVMTVILMPRHPWVCYGIVGALAVALMVTAARHTRGGWRWRSGGGV